MIRYRPGQYFVNGVLWIIVNLFPILSGQILNEFLNSLSGKSSFDFSLVTLVWLFGITAVVRLMMVFLSAYVTIHQRFTMSLLLRVNMLNFVLKKQAAKPLSNSDGETLTLFRHDVHQVEEFISWLLGLVSTAIFTVCAIWILLRIDPALTAYVFIPVTSIAILTYLLNSRVQKLREDSREASSKLLGGIRNIFNALQTIQSFSAEKRMLEQMEGLNTKRKSMLIRESLFQEILNSINHNIINIGTVLIMFFGAKAMLSGDLLIGDFALFIFYLNFIVGFVQLFGRMIPHYTQTSVSIGKLNKFVNDHAEVLVKHVPLSMEGVKEPDIERKAPFQSLQAEDLGYIYPDSGKGVANVNFVVNAGEIVVIAGRAGSGKSTLLKSLLGLLPEAKGKVQWNGSEIMDRSEFFIPPNSAFTKQEPILFSDSIRNNITFEEPIDDSSVQRALYEAVLEDDIKKFEHGLDTEIGQKGVRLSGGQAHRTALARMFLRNAELLIMDDPTSALDSETEHAFWNRLSESRRTCIVISNRKNAFLAADKILLLNDGNMIGMGNLEGLLRHSDVMRSLYYSKKDDEIS